MNRADANVNAKNYYDKTPLYMAVLNGHDETIRLLEKNGGMNICDWTPLEEVQ